MPGFINCHTHTPMVALRGIAEDMAIEEWFNDWIWPIESNLTDRAVELGALLACAETIRGGVTSFADHYFSMDRVAAAVTASGLRANLGWAYFSSQGPEGRERSLDFALRLRGAAGGTLTALVQKSGEHDPTRMTARQALDHATRQSARAIGLEETTGALAPGFRADLILVDLTGPHTQPLHDIASSLVHSARSSDVLTTVVDGRILMRDRRLLNLDVPAIAGELRSLLPDLTKRRRGQRIHNYSG